jgi:hypothetical protein
MAAAERIAVQPPRARRSKSVKKQTISRAKRSAATACSALRSPVFACQSHVPTTPAHSHAGTTSVHLNHARKGSHLAARASIGTTRIENHLTSNGPSASRAVVPHAAPRAFRITGVRTIPGITSTCTTELAQRAFWKCDSLHPYQKRSANCVPRTPNALPISRCERTTGAVKMRTISCAKRSAAWACSAFRPLFLGLPAACIDHIRTEPHRHNGRSVGITHLWNHARHNALRYEPRHSGITLPVTGNPHHGRSYHAGITRLPHNEPTYHTRHHGHQHAGAGTTGVWEG